MVRVFFILVLVLSISILSAYGFILKQKESLSSVGIHSSFLEQMNQTAVLEKTPASMPDTEQSLSELILSSTQPVDFGALEQVIGGRLHYADSLNVDLRHFNQVIDFDVHAKTITVQSGIQWKKLLEIVDQENLSFSVNPDFVEYTVLDALNANVQGRSMAAGPIINEVLSIRIMLSDGMVYEASPDKNPKLFYGAIGGFGGIGVIVQAKLQLQEDFALQRKVVRLGFNEYNNYFIDHVLNDDSVVMHQAWYYPPNYESLLDISWRKTDQAVPQGQTFQQKDAAFDYQNLLFSIETNWSFLQRVQKNVIDYLLNGKTRVESVNYAASESIEGSGLLETNAYTMAVQEYRIPVHRFEIFIFNMREILMRNNVEVLRVQITYAPQGHDAVLVGSSPYMYSFKIIYKQNKTESALKETFDWTREMIASADKSNGNYILPFLINEQFQQYSHAYPRARAWFELKKSTDPKNRFKTMFLAQYQLSKKYNKEVNEFFINPLEGINQAYSSQYMTGW